MITPFSLPHRYPMLLLDRVLAVEPGVSATALRQLTRDDPWVDACGHLPPALLAEMMAQCAGTALVDGSSAGGMLARIDRFRTRGGAPPGGTLWVHTRVIKAFGATVKLRGVVRLGGRRWAAAEIVLQMVSTVVRR